MKEKRSGNRICSIEGCERKHFAKNYCYRHYSRLWRTGDASDRKGMISSLHTRFWNFVRKGADDECWEWKGSLHPAGYGRIGADSPSRKILSAHRVSYEMHKGDIPDGAFVCHRCDNPPCVNPAHLFVGTHQDNMDDMNKKGRGVIPGLKGGEHPMATLKDSDVISIRNDQRKLQEIADDYGVTKSHISNIKHRRVWTHI